MGEKGEKNEGLRRRWSRSLEKTRRSIYSGIGNLIPGKKSIGGDVLLDLERSLLTTDVGVSATDAIIATLERRLSRQELSDPEMLRQALRVELTEIARPLRKVFEIGSARPYVVLLIGVNGAGKTTTIGKLSKH